MTAFSATAENARQSPRECHFDTDSRPLLVDNGSSRGLSNCKADFKNLQPLPKDQVKILGLTASEAPEAVGTMIVNFQDNSGQEHTFEIDDCYYSPSFTARIMCPQQWAQQHYEKFGDTLAHCDTTRQSLVLEWSHGDQLFQKTIPLTKSNVGFTSTSVGFKNYLAFLSLFQATEAVVVSDDEEDSKPTIENQDALPGTTSATPFSFDLSSPHVVPQDDDETPLLVKDQKLLMQYHESLGHASWDQLKVLASQDIIPKKLAKCPAPKCPGCIYGKAHRLP